MPDLKISQMSPAAVVFDADLLAIVQGGANFNCTRGQILVAGTGEDISLSSANAAISVEDVGQVDVLVKVGQPLNLGDSGANQIAQDGSGNTSIIAATSIELRTSLPPAQVNLDNVNGILFACAGGTIQLTNTGQVVLQSVTVPTLVSYPPIAPSFWAGSPPIWLNDAIDRIAAVVSAGGSVPIP